ncbi:hypothetical protein MMC29_008093, partial [Sticta canariensis]|nr:hypothetical protein [Sticta canariensis]
MLFGSAALDGAQAEYVRVPFADGTAVKAPPNIADNALVLMADIFPTGYFAAHNGFKELTKDQIADATVVVIGCGPVGLCALINAKSYEPKNLLAVDSILSRLDLAKSLGAEPWNFQTDREGLDERVKILTDGRGADVVIEVVGLSPALKMGFELLRPWGCISSVGVHNAEACPSLLIQKGNFILISSRFHGSYTTPAIANHLTKPGRATRHMGKTYESKWDVAP